jgi:hypothetical protein
MVFLIYKGEKGIFGYDTANYHTNHRWPLRPESSRVPKASLFSLLGADWFRAFLLLARFPFLEIKT